MYPVEDEHGQEVYGLFYRNSNGYAMAIVAVRNAGYDWKAYMGGCPVYLPEVSAACYVAANGDKLDEALARYLLRRRLGRVFREPYRP